MKNQRDVYGRIQKGAAAVTLTLATFAYAVDISAATAVNKHSNKCIDVAGASAASGALVQQFACNGTSAQNFTLEPVGNGYYTLKTGTGPNLCLDHDSASGSNGTRVIQKTCSGSDQQKFSPNKRSDGSYQLRTTDGRCLDVPGGLKTDNVAIQTWACNENSWQRFSLNGFNDGGRPDLTPAPNPTPNPNSNPNPGSTKTPTIVSVGTSSCVDVPGGSKVSGESLQQWTCTGSAWQSFEFVPTGAHYLIKPKHATELCLDSNSASGNDIDVKTVSCSGSDNQKWQLGNEGNGVYQIRTLDGRCMDVYGNSAANQTRIALFGCDGAVQKKFRLSGVSGIQNPAKPVETPSANGNFQVKNGKIYDPKGNLFVAKGFNVWPDSSYDASFYRDCWKANMVRINHIALTWKGWYNKSQLYATIDAMTAKGMVAMIEWHEVGNIGDGKNGWNHAGPYDFGSGQGHINAINAFHMEFAKHYKNNPYVWFNIINEPGGKPTSDEMARWENMSKQVIDGIRSTGNKSVIIVDGMTWGQDTGKSESDCSVPDEADSAILARGKALHNKGNVAFNIHIYGGWDCNRSARLNEFFNRTEAKGLTVFIGEYNTAAQADVAASLAKNRNIGRLFWHVNSGDSKISNDGKSPNSCTNPTNLNAFGKAVWSDFHK